VLQRRQASAGAQVYPRAPQLLGLLAWAEARGHTVSRLRRDLRTLCAAEGAASPAAWLLAARCEALLPGGAHRVQARRTPFALPIFPAFYFIRSGGGINSRNSHSLLHF
jgi:hypothetical protein